MTDAIHGMDMSDVWTPKMVGERLVEAVRWARYNAGPTGPASVRALYPTYYPSDADRELEGWGTKEIADPDDEPVMRRPLSPKKISAILDALHWPGRYAVNGHPTSTRYLNLWLRCKVHKRNFDKAVDARGEISRASAYRYRDRALSAIAQGLTRDGVPV